MAPEFPDYRTQTSIAEKFTAVFFVSRRVRVRGKAGEIKENLIKLRKAEEKDEGENMRISDRFIFRQIREEEVRDAAKIEQICFPPNEACTYDRMRERIRRAPELFLVAEERETGKIVGFLNGLSTNEERFRDEFFENAALYNPDGANVLLLGLDVLPEYRRQGIATYLMETYLETERKKGRKKVLLTCLDSKVAMYEKMGYHDLGAANSTWGGEQWHEMCCEIN